MRMQPDHGDVAIVSGAIRAVVRAYRPGVHQRAVAVQKVHLPGVECQSAKTTVQGHRLLWKTTHGTDVLYYGTESRHRAGSEVVDLDRAGRIRNAWLDGHLARVDAEWQRRDDGFEDRLLQWICDHDDLSQFVKH